MCPFRMQFGTTWAPFGVLWTCIYGFGQVLEYLLRTQTNSMGKQCTGEGNGGKVDLQGWEGEIVSGGLWRPVGPCAAGVAPPITRLLSSHRILQAWRLR